MGYTLYNQPERFGIATTTSFPRYVAPHNREKSWSDPETVMQTMRGDLALQLVRLAAMHGITVGIVDYQSDNSFLEQLKNTDPLLVHLQLQTEPAVGHPIGHARRQAFSMLHNLPGIEYFGWTEPQKLTTMQDHCFAEAFEAMQETGVDIAIAGRFDKTDEPVWKNYPAFQRELEIDSVTMMNATLREYGFLDRQPNIDLFGTAIYKNNAQILSLLMTRLEKVPNTQADANTRTRIYHLLNPGVYSDTIVLPPVHALFNGIPVRGVPTNFTYDADLAALEAQHNSAKVREQNEMLQADFTEFVKLKTGQKSLLQFAA